MLKIIATLWFCLIASGATQAASQRLWDYPCDAFMSEVCLRLPHDMSLRYSVPADFGVYTIENPEGVLVSMYVGSGPRLSKEWGSPSISLGSQASPIRGYHSIVDGKERLDVIINPVGSKNDFVHLFADFSESKREAIAMVVAGLRRCTRPSVENLRCPIRSDEGRLLAEWVQAQKMMVDALSHP